MDSVLLHTTLPPLRTKEWIVSRSNHTISQSGFGYTKCQHSRYSTGEDGNCVAIAKSSPGFIPTQWHRVGLEPFCTLPIPTRRLLAFWGSGDPPCPTAHDSANESRCREPKGNPLPCLCIRHRPCTVFCSPMSARCPSLSQETSTSNGVLQNTVSPMLALSIGT